MAEIRCCDCPNGSQRCLKDSCPCYLSGESCFERCESHYLRSNCLNQKPTHCKCVTISSKTANPKDRMPICGTNRCTCYRYQEACSDLCECKRACTNETPLENPARKDLPGVVGCKCNGGGKKSCSKYSKCMCKSILNYCNPLCKCASSCTNAEKVQVPPNIRSIFTKPDQESMALIAKINGAENYNYRLIFAMEEKDKFKVHPEVQFCDALLFTLSKYRLQIESIDIFMTKSPCFHQDCDPKCEIMDTCETQRACAVRLCTLFSQVKRLTQNSDVSMTLKFLSPYVKRGDLYTKQALQALMESGIEVEPLGLREWGALLQENAERSDPVSAQINFWAAAGMDENITQAQTYVNYARRVLGIQEGLWISPFHDALKNAILTCGITQHRLNKLGKQLQKAAWEQQSIYDESVVHGARPRHAGIRKAKSFHHERPNVGKDDISIPHPGSSDSLIDRRSDVPIEEPSIKQAKILEHMILYFSTKSLSPQECGEIRAALTSTMEHMQGELATLVQFLQRKCDYPSDKALENGSATFVTDRDINNPILPETDL